MNNYNNIIDKMKIYMNLFRCAKPKYKTTILDRTFNNMSHAARGGTDSDQDSTLARGIGWNVGSVVISREEKKDVPHRGNSNLSLSTI